jgi:hypothetical protein
LSKCTSAAPHIGTSASALQLLADLFLHLVELCHTSVNAYAFSLVQVRVCVSWTDALVVT